MLRSDSCSPLLNRGLRNIFLLSIINSSYIAKINIHNCLLRSKQTDMVWRNRMNIAWSVDVTVFAYDGMLCSLVSALDKSSTKEYMQEFWNFAWMTRFKFKKVRFIFCIKYSTYSFIWYISCSVAFYVSL